MKEPTSVPLSIVSAAVIDRQTVGVVAKGPRGGTYTFTASFSLGKGALTGAYRESPSPAYLPLGIVPPEVAYAARGSMLSYRA